MSVSPHRFFGELLHRLQHIIHASTSLPAVQVAGSVDTVYQDGSEGERCVVNGARISSQCHKVADPRSMLMHVEVEEGASEFDNSGTDGVMLNTV